MSSAPWSSRGSRDQCGWGDSFNSNRASGCTSQQHRVRSSSEELEEVIQLHSVLQSLSHVQLFATPWAAARQVSLSFTISQSRLKLMSMESVTPSNHLVLCQPFLLLPSILPSTRVFPKELALCFRWPKYRRFTFSISPSNEYSGLISLGLSSLISLLSKGLSRVFSNNTVQKHQLFRSQPSLWFNSHIHT